MAAHDSEYVRQFDAFCAYDSALDACRRGDLEAAKAALSRAFDLDPDLRLAAVDDEDLDPLWRSL